MTNWMLRSSLLQVAHAIPLLLTVVVSSPEQVHALDHVGSLAPLGRYVVEQAFNDL
jgi:hypothetical protein